VVVGKRPGLDLSWFDPMSVEVTAGRCTVPYVVPRSSPLVAQVVPRHLPAGALVSVVAASRSPATVPMRSVFSRLSASFFGFSLRRPVGGGAGGLPLLLGRLLLARSSQLPLPRRTARRVVVRRRGRLWSLRSSLWLLYRVRGATCTPLGQSLLLSQPRRSLGHSSGWVCPGWGWRRCCGLEVGRRLLCLGSVTVFG
jgi:hypothetical protein